MYDKEFDNLNEREKSAILTIQILSKRYWWNPYCKTACLNHNKIHKYSFEAYVEGFVTGYFGFDTEDEIIDYANELSERYKTK